MAKYDVTATVTISTEIEPQGYIDDPTYNIDGISDFNAESFSSYGTSIEEECEISFVWEVDTEDVPNQEHAEAEISDRLQGSLTYTGDDIEWEITNISIDSCERQDMSVEDAIGVVRTFLDTREDAFKAHHPLVVEALEVLLQQY